MVKNISIEQLIQLSQDRGVVLAAQLQNSEYDQVRIGQMIAQGQTSEEARTAQRSFRGEQLGLSMRAFGLKDAKSLSSGLIELLVNMRYREIQTTDLAAAREKLNEFFG